MTTLSLTAIALLGYIALYLVLTTLIFSYRSILISSGKKKANEFKTDGSDVDEFSKRLARAHANLYESFVWFGGLLLFALATAQTEITNGLAIVFLGLRIAQATVHLASTVENAVKARFVLFLGQIGIAVYWLVSFFL